MQIIKGYTRSSNQCQYVSISPRQTIYFLKGDEIQPRRLQELFNFNIFQKMRFKRHIFKSIDARGSKTASLLKKLIIPLEVRLFELTNNI